MRKVLMISAGVIVAVVLVAVTVRTLAQPSGPGYGMMGQGYGPGMMGYCGQGDGDAQNTGQACGPGMMGWGGGGQGHGPGWMMHGNGGGGGYGQGYGQGYGPGMMYGYGAGQANQTDLNLTADQVKQYLGQMIRNPNLKVGDVKEKDADTIVAEVITKDKDALVQRLQFNRHNGFVQPEQ
jgi:hypothetical protein